MLDRTDFQYVCNIIPVSELNGTVKEFYPQQEYDNKKRLKLHKYGKGPFCKFKIPNDYRKNGVYLICVNETPKYVGECDNFSNRFNSGYGNISPRNCYVGGQQTNCRINNLILESIKKDDQIRLFFQETRDRFELEDKLIAQIHPEWNKSKKQKNFQRAKHQEGTGSNVIHGKYLNLQKYLQNSKKPIEVLSYSNIENILEFELPRSAYKYTAWWSNGGHTQANAWLNVGWKVKSVILTDSVTFVKTAEILTDSVTFVKTAEKSEKALISTKTNEFWCGTCLHINRIKQGKTKVICYKCGNKYTYEEWKKNQFCSNCGLFLTLM